MFREETQRPTDELHTISSTDRYPTSLTSQNPQENRSGQRFWPNLFLGRWLKWFGGRAASGRVASICAALQQRALCSVRYRATKRLLCGFQMIEELDRDFDSLFEVEVAKEVAARFDCVQGDTFVIDELL